MVRRYSRGVVIISQKRRLDTSDKMYVTTFVFNDHYSVLEETNNPLVQEVHDSISIVPA